jgi:hypothetical protein
MSDHLYAFLAHVKINAPDEDEHSRSVLSNPEEGRQRLAIGHLQAAVLGCKPRFARKVTRHQIIAAQRMLSDCADAARICRLLKLEEEQKTTVRKDASGTTYIEVAP